MIKIILYLSIIVLSYSFINHKNFNNINTFLNSRKSDINDIKNLFYSYDKINNNNKIINNLYKPRSSNQKDYIDKLNNDDITILVGIGPAGTGKTLFACIHAIDKLRNKEIDKIVLTRPLIKFFYK